MARFATELSMLILSRIESKYAVPVRSASSSSVFLSSSHFAVLRRKIVVGISEQSLGGGCEFRIVITRAQRLARVRRGRHRVNIRIVGISRVCVMIERRDLLDLRQQTLIDLLERRARETGGLGQRKGCMSGNQESMARNAIPHIFLRNESDRLISAISERQPFPARRPKTFRIRSTASFKVAIEDANEKRMKSLPPGQTRLPEWQQLPPLLAESGTVPQRTSRFR